MPQPYLFHIQPQQTTALLGPAVDDLERVAVRLRHYVDHLRLSAEDAERMRQAADAVAGAAAAVRSIQSGRREG